MESVFPYCAKFGFDDRKIKSRLNFLHLSHNDTGLIQRLHEELIDPNLELIIERFYEYLLAQAESRAILSSGGIIQRLKTAQHDYLLSLGINFHTPAYFEERLRIGMVHAWVGLPLGVYLCAYRALNQLIIQQLPACNEDNAQQQQALMELLYKITTLDMSLAIDTYHSAQLSSLEEEVSRMHAETDHLLHKARTDSLTGLMNHENTYRYLEQAMRIARKLEHPLCVLMADLDYFKRVNDTHGHRVGDSVLREVAARILASVRSPDAVGRYGGEEFMIILSDADLETAKVIAERIRQRIADTPIAVKDTQVNITISLGLSMLQADDTVESLVNRADQALYAAKGAGRNCIQTVS